MDLRRAVGRWAAGALLLGAAVLGGCAPAQELLAYIISPTPTVTVTATATVTETATPTATPSLTPTDTPVPPTDTPIPTDTATPSPQPSETVTVTDGPSPTPTRSPTFTRTATRTRWPTLTKAPTRTRTITKTPTVTFTPTPPYETLRITRPGLFSKVSSPFRVEAMIKPGDDGYVNLRLIGEDARTVSEAVLDYRALINRRFWLSHMMTFDISAAAETARLEMRINDTFGRAISISSVDLILLKVGDNEITPSVLDLEPYLFRYPYRDQEIKGGTLLVLGLARPVNAKPVILELIDESGRVVGSKEITVEAPTGDLSHTPFQADIPYQVDGRTPVRLSIRQESDQRIPGTVALSSMLIVLEP